MTLPGLLFFLQPVPVQWEGPCSSPPLVPPCRVIKMCQGQRVVAALSFLSCGQLLPDVFDSPPEPRGWTLLLSALPTQQHSSHRLEMKHGRGRGSSNTFRMPRISVPCVRPIPCPGKVPVRGALVSHWVKAVQNKVIAKGSAARFTLD